MIGKELLSVAEYDEIEAAATRGLSYPQIRAFAPAGFLQANFPTRVRDEAELVRYCDIMHELADFDFLFRQLRYSRHEADLITTVSDTIESLTKSRFQRPVRPLMNLLPPINIVRAVVALASPDSTILEIGPGCGLLGAYLIKSGFRYRAIDNTQAFYLWQNRLFSHLAHNEFTERATTTDGAHDTRVEHIPWWQFADMFRQPPPLDIIICDGAMAEMEHFAVWYIIRLAAAALRSSRIGAFIYSNIGDPRLSSLAHIEQIFALAGFHKQVCGDLTIQTVQPRILPAEWPAIGGAAKLRAIDFVPMEPAGLLDNYDFFAFMGINKSADEYRLLRQTEMPASLRAAE
jgi:hypothetical protein